LAACPVYAVARFGSRLRSLPYLSEALGWMTVSVSTCVLVAWRLVEVRIRCLVEQGLGSGIPVWAGLGRRILGEAPGWLGHVVLFARRDATQVSSCFVSEIAGPDRVASKPRSVWWSLWKVSPSWCGHLLAHQCLVTEPSGFNYSCGGSRRRPLLCLTSILPVCRPLALGSSEGGWSLDEVW
jgi:hypothetical protein